MKSAMILLSLLLGVSMTSTFAVSDSEEETVFWKDTIEEDTWEGKKGPGKPCADNERCRSYNCLNGVDGQPDTCGKCEAGNDYGECSFDEACDVSVACHSKNCLAAGTCGKQICAYNDECKSYNCKYEEGEEEGTCDVCFADNVYGDCTLGEVCAVSVACNEKYYCDKTATTDDRGAGEEKMLHQPLSDDSSTGKCAKKEPEVEEPEEEEPGEEEEPKEEEPEEEPTTETCEVQISTLQEENADKIAALVAKIAELKGLSCHQCKKPSRHLLFASSEDSGKTTCCLTGPS